MEKRISESFDLFTECVENIYEYSGPQNPKIMSVTPIRNAKSGNEIENGFPVKSLRFVFVSRTGYPCVPKKSRSVRVVVYEEGLHWKNVMKEGCSLSIVGCTMVYPMDELRLEDGNATETCKYEDLRKFAMYIYKADFMKGEMKINPIQSIGIMIGTKRYLVSSDQIHKMSNRYTIISIEDDRYVQRSYIAHQSNEFVVGMSESVYVFDGYYIEANKNFEVEACFLYQDYMKINENFIAGDFLTKRHLSTAINMPELSEIRKEIDMKTMTDVGGEYDSIYDHYDINPTGSVRTYN